MTEIQDLNDLYQKLKQKQINITTSFLYESVGRHKTLLDLSNKYLFDICIYQFKKLILKTYSTQLPLRYLILQNCLLTASSAHSVLSTFLSFPGKLNIILIDIGNNSITFTPSLSNLLSKLFDKSIKSESKKLKVQGNLFPDREALNPLLKNPNFELLNLYDCCLSSEVLLALSDQLSQNVKVQKLDLSYNSGGFSLKSTVFSFGIAAGLNSNLTCLKLSGVTALSKLPYLEKLCVGLKNSASLERLVLSNIPLTDKGLKVLRKKCFDCMSIEVIDLQNTALTSVGIGKLMKKLPDGLIKLGLAYNLINEAKLLSLMGKFLGPEKNLRHLNLSYCFSFDGIETSVLNCFCRGITENRSLSELFLEGCKINDDPDEFCKLLSIAIEERKYPICFKISAVRTGNGNAANYLSKTQERILKDITE